MTPGTAHWWKEFKKNLTKASFLEKDALRYRDQLENLLGEKRTGQEKMMVLARFKSLGVTIQANMLQSTIRWMEEVTSDLYLDIYHQQGTSKRIKIRIISYLLTHNKSIPEMGQDLTIWVEEDDNDWEVFDLLTRFPHLLNEEQNHRVQEWAENNRYRPTRNFGMDEQLEEEYHRRRRDLENVPSTIREMEIEFERWRRLERLPIKNVYQDRQNIHNKAINSSVWSNIQILMEENLERTCLDNFERIEAEMGYLDKGQTNSLHRIYSDQSQFIHKNMKRPVTLWSVFLMVWAYRKSITEEDIQRELLQRIKEELGEMKLTCATGHLSRLVNVLVGFHPRIQIQISEADRIKGVFHSQLQNIIMEDEAVDTLLADLTNPKEEGEFHDFCKKNWDSLVDHLMNHLEIKERQSLVKELKRIWENSFPTLSYSFLHPQHRKPWYRRILPEEWFQFRSF